MEYNLVIAPPAPLIVPELGGNSEPARALRDACRRSLSDAFSCARPSISADNPQEISCGIVFLARQRDWTGHRGSLRAWGRDVQVGDGNHLPELIARWLIKDRAHNQGFDAGGALPRIETFDSIRSAVDSSVDLIMVMADGPSGLVESSPHGLLPGAGDLNQWCGATAAGRLGSEARSADAQGVNSMGNSVEAVADTITASTGWGAFPLWQQLAELSRSEGIHAEVYYAGAPYGIGYHVASWHWRKA